jgi:hypothetical protein
VLAGEVNAPFGPRHQGGHAAGELNRPEERVGATRPGVLVPAGRDAALELFEKSRVHGADRLEREADALFAAHSANAAR